MAAAARPYKLPTSKTPALSPDSSTTTLHDCRLSISISKPRRGSAQLLLLRLPFFPVWVFHARSAARLPCAWVAIRCVEIMEGFRPSWKGTVTVTHAAAAILLCAWFFITFTLSSGSIRMSRDAPFPGSSHLLILSPLVFGLPISSHRIPLPHRSITSRQSASKPHQTGAATTPLEAQRGARAYAGDTARSQARCGAPAARHWPGPSTRFALHGQVSLP